MHIRPATRHDLADIATVAHRAMFGDQLSLWLGGAPAKSQPAHIHRERCLRFAIKRWNNGLFMMVMVLDENDHEWRGKEEIIGYAAYEKHVGAPDDSAKRLSSVFDVFERWAWRVQENYIYYMRNNLGTDRARHRMLVKELTNLEGRVPFDKFWELDFLAVDPTYYRRGIGSALLAWGQQRATEDDAPLWLWSSVVGEHLYRKQGFEVCSSFTLGPLFVPAMVWKPESNQ